MASFWYNNGIYKCLQGTPAINILTDTIKLMLVKSGYVENKDHDFVDEAGANDPIDEELTVSGYTPGFGGAGRKTCTITGQVNDTNDRADFAIADLTWTALGAGETIAKAILIKEITNDAASPLIVVFDVTDTATNGGDVTLDFATLAAGGNMQVAT